MCSTIFHRFLSSLRSFTRIFFTFMSFHCISTFSPLVYLPIVITSFHRISKFLLISAILFHIHVCTSFLMFTTLFHAFLFELFWFYLHLHVFCVCKHLFQSFSSLVISLHFDFLCVLFSYLCAYSYNIVITSFHRIYTSLRSYLISSFAHSYSNHFYVYHFISFSLSNYFLVYLVFSSYTLLLCLQTLVPIIFTFRCIYTFLSFKSRSFEFLCLFTLIRVFLVIFLILTRVCKHLH